MSKGKQKKSSAQATGKRGDVSWQAQKSAMTHDRILDAAIDSFVRLGYTNVTTAKVASAAGVSRGAMLHHFPSKSELIQAAIEYLHHKLLQNYTDLINGIPKNLNGEKRRRAGLDAYWQYLTGDLFIAYHELCVAGRTDDELKSVLESSTAAFDNHVYETNRELFKEWSDRPERLLLAIDVTKFMMEGMAVGQLVNHREERIRVMLDYLADRLGEIYNEGESTAAGRHAART